MYNKKSLRVIIADDHHLVLIGLRLILQQLRPNAIIQETNNFQTVLDMVDADPLLNLVILDRSMPGTGPMDGIACLRQIKERRPQLPVVIYSGFEEQEMVREALALGAMGYIPKTAPATEVRHALTMILLGRIYLPLHLFNNNRQEAGEEFSPPQPGAVSVVAIVPEEIHDLSLPLTERQLEVLRYLEQGMSNKEIAMAILCAENTIKNHVAAIFRALGVHSRIKALEAVRRMRLGLPGGKL